MLLSFTEGFLLGLGAAVPLGPINILIMNEAIKKYSSAVLIGFGAMSADVSYLLLIVFGLIVFINQVFILNILTLFGAGFLIYLSYLLFKNKDANLNGTNQNSFYESKKKLYLKGFVLTALNPYTIGFWLSASSYVASKELDALETLAGMLCAITLWIIIMPYMVHKTKHKISKKVSYWISVVSAVVLFGFGIVMFLSLAG